MDELSQLDALVESDILEALGQEANTTSNENEITIQDHDESITIEDIEEKEITEDTAVYSREDKDISISNIKSDDLASLLSQLLNNKTIEITIKIKD
jgi:hypothetical protein